MSIDERDRRATAGGREGAGRAPRSGGRITGQRETGDGARRTPAERAAADRASADRMSVRGTRGDLSRPAARHETRGTAAVKLDTAEPIRVTAVAPPQLRVAPPAPIRTPRAPFVAVVIAIVLAGVLGILWINTKTMENSFRISRLQDQQSALDNQQQQLERQLANYENTGNLDAAARMLGLVKSDRLAYITLPNGDVIGVPRPNTGPPSVTARDARPSDGSGSAQDAGSAGSTKDAGAAQVAGR